MTRSLHVTLISLLFSTTLVIADYEEAEELFNEASCMDCHNNGDFKHKKNKVSNFTELHNAVDACRFGNGADWFDDESMEVSKYLNSKFYKYKNIDIK